MTTKKPETMVRRDKLTARHYWMGAGWGAFFSSALWRSHSNDIASIILQALPGTILGAILGALFIWLLEGNGAMTHEKKVEEVLRCMGLDTTELPSDLQSRD